MLAGAAEIARQRQKSKKALCTYGDYRAMLNEKDLDNYLRRPYCAPWQHRGSA
jgi:hypothetical protein